MDSAVFVSVHSDENQMPSHDGVYTPRLDEHTEIFSYDFMFTRKSPGNCFIG